MAAITRTQKMVLEERLLTHISNAMDAQLTAMTLHEQVLAKNQIWQTFSVFQDLIYFALIRI